jgi:hypothetical protein
LKIGIYNAFRSQANEPYDTQVVYFDGISQKLSRFSDQPLFPQITPVRTFHITELRTAVDTLRAHYALGAFTWTDASLMNGSVVKAVHVSELRAALSQVYAAANLPAPTFTDPLLDASVAIKAAHVEELRNYVMAVENLITNPRSHRDARAWLQGHARAGFSPNLEPRTQNR